MEVSRLRVNVPVFFLIETGAGIIPIFGPLSWAFVIVENEVIRTISIRKIFLYIVNQQLGYNNREYNRI